MNFKQAKAVRKKVSWLLKGKLSQAPIGNKFPAYGSAVVEDTLLYWVQDWDGDCDGTMLAGYECGRGGLGRCMFCIWWSIGREEWSVKLHDCCPVYLDAELESLIEELNNEEEDC